MIDPRVINVLKAPDENHFFNSTKKTGRAFSLAGLEVLFGSWRSHGPFWKLYPSSGVYQIGEE